MSNLEHLRPMAEVFIKAKAELEHKRGYVKIECPECEGVGCIECDGLGMMQVCQDCLGTGTTEQQTAADHFRKVRCDETPNCGLLYKHNAEDLREV